LGAVDPGSNPGGPIKSGAAQSPRRVFEKHGFEAGSSFAATEVQIRAVPLFAANISVSGENEQNGDLK
jgi:hypothetical protein